jgi:hypothetical protein
MTNSEHQDNKRALDHAVAQQRLEGLTVTPETLADLTRVASGEISTASVIDNLYARYAHVTVLQY